MTTAADDRSAEEAFEACLAGRPVHGNGAALAAFTGAVREAGTLPGRPNAALAELLATGHLTDQSSPSTRTAPAAGSPSRVRIRRRFAMIFPVLLAKFLSAGAVAQAATGAGVVVVVVAGAGSVGVLPGPAQETFTSLVGDEQVVDAPEDVADTTEEEEPLVEEEPSGPAEIPAEPVLVDEADGLVDDDVAADGDVVDAEEPTEQELWAETGPEEGQSFGSWVSEGARQGWVDGATVSEWAHKRNEERRRAAREEQSPEETVEVAEDSGDDGAVEEGEVEEGEVKDSSTDRDGDRHDKGKENKGNGRGNGRD